jgi:sporulation protein YlmC with PRC-barrel domain
MKPPVLAAAVSVSIILGATVSALASGGLGALPETAPSATVAPFRTAVVGNARLDEAIVGQTVYGPSGRRVGEIANVVTTEDGTVHQIILQYGGFLGFGSKTTAIDASKVHRNGDRLLVEYTEAELRAADSQVN